ncbi:hypothetical protein Tco_1394041 [Tanacetum coccineum]
MFEPLKELTVSRTLEKVLIREETRHPTTKNVNSISRIRIEEEKSVENNGATDRSVAEPRKYDEQKPPKEVDKPNESGRRANEEPAKDARENVTKNKEEEPAGVSSSHAEGYYLKHRINEKLIEGLVENQRLTDKRPAETDIRLSLASHSYISPLGIADDVLVDIPAKAVIKFDKGTITLKSGKSKIGFHRIPEPHCRIEKGIKNNIEPIAPTMTVNSLVLEWEEKIKLHQENEMKFDQWKSKIFSNEHPTSVKEECKLTVEKGVT